MIRKEKIDKQFYKTSNNLKKCEKNFIQSGAKGIRRFLVKMLPKSE